jgi:hypothetical protein
MNRKLNLIMCPEASHIHIREMSHRLMMEAASTSETSVNFTRLPTRRNITEDSYLHTRRRENVKFHHGNEPSVSIKDAEFLDQVSDCRFLEYCAR